MGCAQEIVACQLNVLFLKDIAASFRGMANVKTRRRLTANSNNLLGTTKAMKEKSKRIEFRIFAPQAKNVHLCGPADRGGARSSPPSRIWVP